MTSDLNSFVYFYFYCVTFPNYSTLKIQNLGLFKIPYEGGCIVVSRQIKNKPCNNGTSGCYFVTIIVEKTARSVINNQYSVTVKCDKIIMTFELLVYYKRTVKTSTYYLQHVYIKIIMISFIVTKTGPSQCVNDSFFKQI